MANIKKSAIETRVCVCGCKRSFDCKPVNPKRFFDRGCASRANAKQSVKYKPLCRKSKAGVKARALSGFGAMNASLREYEDKQIALGKLPPRQSLRDKINASILSQITSAKYKRKKKAQQKQD